MAKTQLYTGRVTRTLGGYYSINPQGEGEVVLAFIRGRLKKDGYRILVGDEVTYQYVNKEQVIIEEILPRSSVLQRPRMANVDRVIVTFSLQQPSINYHLLDRYLIFVEHAGFQVVICMNKLDLEEDPTLLIKHDTYRAIGYPTIHCSAITGDGLGELKEALRDGVNVFAGPSGVGKSALLNALNPNLHLKTGEISTRLKKGRHTTRQAELFILKEGTFVADTPGFSSLSLGDMHVHELQYSFPDFDPYREDCYYHSCIHDQEPKCGVKKAVQGEKILKSRYETYKTILQELKGKERF